MFYRGNIAGVTFSNNNSQSRLNILQKVQIGEKLQLVKEPMNEVDPSAIKVMSKQGQLGYIKAADLLKFSLVSLDNVKVILLEKNTLKTQGITYGKIEVWCNRFEQNQPDIKSRLNKLFNL
jgi:hypothetical protein